jgi:hypothetical protein
MRFRWIGGVGLGLALGVGSAPAQELDRHPAPAGVAAAPITLGRPQPIYADSPVLPASYAGPTATMAVPTVTLSTPRPIIRGQSPDFPSVNVPPPPPPPPGPSGPGAFGGPAVFPGGPPVGAVVGPGAEAYNCGVVNNNADLGGFWARCGDRLKRCWTGVTGTVADGFSSRTLFQSDHEFDCFISPVSNPIYFEDPRALTEFRPVFMWQHTRDSNPVYAGGDNYFAVLQGRLAITPWASIVVNKLGWTFNNPENPVPGVEDANGFSELHIGPKFTFLRLQDTQTVAALGLNFEMPIGSDRIGQGTGNLSLSPYFSAAQSFLRSDFGTFNFMNTTGYSFAVDSRRTDFLYASFHLDYNILNANRYFPLVELNWTRYTFNGSARSLGFEGSNLFNFGSDGVAGQDDLTLAVGGRIKFTEAIQLGIAGEFSVLGGRRHLDDFRLTVDMIFRY